MQQCDTPDPAVDDEESQVYVRVSGQDMTVICRRAVKGRLKG